MTRTRQRSPLPFLLALTVTVVAAAQLSVRFDPALQAQPTRALSQLAAERQAILEELK